MSLDVGEHGAKVIESVMDTRFSLLVMRHWVLPVYRPEADFGVNSNAHCWHSGSHTTSILDSKAGKF